MTRYVALLRDPAPLRGICPACDRVMDESGCRLGEHLVSRDIAHTKGIAQIVEAFCCGAPAVSIVECPACP